MAEASLSEDHDEVLVRQPFRHLFHCLAVRLPQSVTRGEKDGEGGRVRLVVFAKHGKIRGVWCQTVQLLVVKLDLFLDEGTSRVKFP